MHAEQSLDKLKNVSYSTSEQKRRNEFAKEIWYADGATGAELAHYWKVSAHVLSRIETPSALAGRSALCEYWS